jgi:hypothetical protein
MDNFVFINNHLAFNQISKGVATFDGLNQHGRAYDINKINTDTADVLTTHPIDLTGVTDTVILSFYYQAGGLCEVPSSNDSLTVRFFNPTTLQWNSVWRAVGIGDTTRFRLAQIPVTNPDYLKNGFQIQFMSYGSTAGGYDVWHIDYLRMRDNVGLGDSTFTDPSLISSAPSALNNYEALPWFHYVNAPDPSVFHKRDFNLRYRKNLVQGGSTALTLGASEINYNGSAVIPSITGNPTLDDPHTVANRVYSYVHTLPQYNITPPPIGEFEYEIVYTFSGASLGSFPSNDTLRKRQIFRNYYAFDDGTAERAYEVTDNAGGFILNLCQLQAVNRDSLKGVYIYFAQANQDLSQNDFTILVYENDNGLPGDLIYESDSVYDPVVSDRDFYLPYVLDQAVEINGSAFIGIRQRTITPLTIGFDLNTPNRSPIFYGTKANLSQSFIDGNIMMRPYFRYIPTDISISESHLQDLSFNIFPNPSQGDFHIDISNSYDNETFSYQVLSLSGQLLQTGSVVEKSINVENLKAGIYLLQINSSNPNVKPGVKKIIIQN